MHYCREWCTQLETPSVTNSINCNNISCTLLNARSLKSVTSECNKLEQLQNIANVDEDDIIAITETWLNNNIADSEILNNEYIIYRRDRQQSENLRGGGVLLAVKSSLKSSLVHTDESSEIIAVSVASSSNQNILFILCYRAPSNDISCFVNSISLLLNKVHTKFSKICLLGDFNLPGIKWDTDHYFSNCFKEMSFVDVCYEFGFKQLNSNPSTVKVKVSSKKGVKDDDLVEVVFVFAGLGCFL